MNWPLFRPLLEDVRKPEVSGCMAVDNVPEHLLQACVAYQRKVALIHLDTPPGDAREARLAEAMAQGAEAYTFAAIEALQRLARGGACGTAGGFATPAGLDVKHACTQCPVAYAARDPDTPADRDMSGG